MPTTHYTKEHEYIRVEDNIGIVGITDFAQGQLGDIVFVELPAIGSTLTKGTEAAVVESVKAASAIYVPVSGEVVEVNSDLQEAPGTVNEDPMAKGWVLKIKLSDQAELANLMDETAYDAYLKSIG